MIGGETVCVTGHRAGNVTLSVTLPARMVDDGTEDAVSDVSTSSQIERFTFFVRRADWYADTMPQCGDVVARTADEFTYRVIKVATLGPMIAIYTRRN